MEDIRKVSTIFTIDDSDHNRKLKQINDQYKLTQSEIKLAGQRMDAFGRSTGDLGFKQSALTKQIETLNSKTKLYNDSIAKTTVRADENNKKLAAMKERRDSLTASYKEAINVHGVSSEQAKKLSVELDEAKKNYQEQERVVRKNVDTINNYQTQLNKVEGELVQTQAELDKVNRELDISRNKWLTNGKALQEAGEKMQNAGKQMQTVGRNLTTYVTLPLVAMGAAAVNEAVKFESAFAGVKKTVNGTAEQIAFLRQGIIDMSLEIPSTTQEISAVAEAAGQLGIKTDSIIDFTKVIIDLGNATNIIGNEGASQLAKFANITQMSQKDFDRLGSTIVELGNNLATTEADIVSMAMRLAGAGAQVGMTEAEILALSGALSSVGIEAEAGGSAFSKVMIQMQLAAETGGGSLKNFAKVAGMSAKDFAKAYKEDATGALIAFIQGLADSESKGISAIKVLDDMGISEVRMRDALLRAANASGLFTDAVALGNKAWAENVALTNEANQRYATTESQMKITKNQIADLGREVGEELLPIVKDGLVIIKDLVTAFKDLEPETQKNIIKFGMLAAALGPLLSIGGKVVSGAGSLVSLAGTLAVKLAGAGGVASAATAAGTAAGAAGGAAGMGALAGGLGAAAAAAAPFVVAGAAVVGTGYLIYDNLTEDVIPAVDLFADKVTYASDAIGGQTASLAGTVETSVVRISDATQEAVQAYIDMDAQATNQLMELYLNGTAITDDIVGDLSTKFGEMNTTIVAGFKKQKEDSIVELNELFELSTSLSSDAQEDILQETGAYYDQKQNVAQEYEDQILAIYQRAADESRAITVEEAQEIGRLQFGMKDLAVKALSETEIEATAIRERLAKNQERITAQSASEYIKKVNQVRDEAVKAANDEYTERVATVIRMRDELGLISDEQANLMLDAAERTKNETIMKAEDTRLGAIDQFRAMYGELDDTVNTQTGNMLTQMDRLKRWWSGWDPEKKQFTATITTIEDTRNSRNNSKTNRAAYALGTSNAIGGLTKVQEQGYELIDLPAGSKVRNHVSSKQMIEDITTQTVAKLSKYAGGVNINNPQFIVNNELDIDYVAKELARRTEIELGGVGYGYSTV